MTKAELENLAAKYQAKADKAYMAYQETGTTRYDRERQNAEDLAEALRMAANAEEDHTRMIHMRAMVSSLAAEAAQIQYAAEDQKQERMESVIKGLVSYAKGLGLIREGGNMVV